MRHLAAALPTLVCRRRRSQSDKGDKYEIDSLIGLGRFGRHIAQELNELGHQVMAIDSNEDRVNAVLSYVTNAQIGDSTSEYFLRPLVLAILMCVS